MACAMVAACGDATSHHLGKMSQSHAIMDCRQADGLCPPPPQQHLMCAVVMARLEQWMVLHCQWVEKMQRRIWHLWGFVVVV